MKPGSDAASLVSKLTGALSVVGGGLSFLDAAAILGAMAASDQGDLWTIAVNTSKIYFGPAPDEIQVGARSY
jgi:hypothetical protein